MTQAGTRYGCFLPDLTGLARSLSIPAFRPHATRARQSHATGRTLATRKCPMSITTRPNPEHGMFLRHRWNTIGEMTMVRQVRGAVSARPLGSGEGKTMHAGIADRIDEIAQICPCHRVQRLDLIVSAARGTDFVPENSDPDFLVEFEPPLLPGVAERFFSLQSDLAEAPGRTVELRQEAAIRNPYVLASIERDRETVFAAQGPGPSAGSGRRRLGDRDVYHGPGQGGVSCRPHEAGCGCLPVRGSRRGTCLPGSGSSRTGRPDPRTEANDRFRNHLAQGYHHIDHVTLWYTATRDLPEPRRKVRDLLSGIESAPAEATVRDDEGQLTEPSSFDR